MRWKAVFVGLACLGLVASRGLATEPVATELEVAKPAGEATPPGPPSAASTAEGYYALGTWRIGMSRADALTHFTQVESTAGAPDLRAIAQANFARDVPATLTFAEDRLETVQLHLYRGKDFEQALRSLQAALRHMNEHFGGSNFEGGLKTWKDPDAKLLRQVLHQSTDAIAAGIREAEAKARKKKKNRGDAGRTAFRLTMNFWTELVAEHNFLLGEYRYTSSTGEYQVNLFDDRQFVKSRIPEASVHLFSYEEEPAP